MRRRRVDGGKLSDYLGELVGLEGYFQLLAIARAIDLDFDLLVGVEGEKLGFEPHHGVLFTMDKNLGGVLG